MPRPNVHEKFAPTMHPAFRRGLVEFSANESSQHADLLRAVFDDEVLGAVVRGVFDKPTIAALVETLGSGGTNVPHVPSEHYGGSSYGEMLIVSQDMNSYFASAARMRGLSSKGIDIETRICEVLGNLAGGWPLELAPSPHGGTYSPVTVRVVEPGGSIDVHCENETVGFSNMAHLRTLIDVRDQISFYTPLVLPEGGGMLGIHPLRHGEPSGHPLHSRSRNYSDIGADLARLESVVPNVGVGDLLLFDAGRYFHNVSPVVGPRARWTLGGFLARAASGERIVYWS